MINQAPEYIVQRVRNDQFTETGSEQTQGKHSKKSGVFLQGPSPRPVQAHLDEITAVSIPLKGVEYAFFEPCFNYRAKNDRDTKTGSGQTWEKLRKTAFVFQSAGADA